MSAPVSGYTVGTVDGAGYCSECGRTLHRGDRAGLHHTSRNLYCLDCVKDGDARFVSTKLIFAAALLAAIVLHLVR